MRAVGSYDEADLVEVLERNVQAEEVESMYGILRAMHKELKSLKNENIEGKKDNQKNQKS